MIRRTLLAAALAAMPIAAAPTLTTIQDLLYKADGTRFSGTLTISWTSFVAADNSSIATQSTTVKVIDGNLRVQLVPTTTGNPPITYSVVYNSDGRVQFQETWAVPVSATPVRVRDVRIASSSSSSGSGGIGADTGSVTESQVTGLIADLGARPVKGPAFTAGRVAVVNSSGAVESAIGTLSDCVHVDGSSGPCGSDSGATPAFIDGETPTGIVDGSNTSFTLSAVPNPAASLAVYRNGILMKATFDYTLTGNSVAFITAAAPQPGDTLLASYRNGASSGSSSPTYSSPEVLCSGTGSSTNSATLLALASCAIPAGLLAQGDRVEIRFDYAHTGASGGFSVEAQWGATTLLQRDSLSSETLLTGRADSSMRASGSQLSSQTWGAAGAMVTSATPASDDYASGVTITLLGSVAQPADSLALANFTVVRIP